MFATNDLTKIKKNKMKRKIKPVNKRSNRKKTSNTKYQQQSGKAKETRLGKCKFILNNNTSVEFYST